MDFKSRWPVRIIGVFLYVWLMIGFALGTLVLVGPVRWIAEGVRHSSYGAHENKVMVLVILAYIAFSFLLSRWLVGFMGRARANGVRYAVPGLATVAAAIALWGWTNPAVYAGVAGGTKGNVAMATGAQFTFGPYPDAKRIAELKKEGITGLISLQHPAVVPFEPPAIAAEKANAASVGMQFISAPMLPWVSSNEESLNKIREVAKSGKGRYYVHCGLGRDRTSVVLRMLEQMGTSVAKTADSPRARNWTIRLKERGNTMERGTFREVEEGLWMVPWPNDHELYGNMLAGQVKHVVLVLDPKSKEHAAWIEKAKKVFGEAGVPYALESMRPHEKDKIGGIVRRARALPRPATIIVPQSYPRDRSEVADMMLAGFGLERIEPFKVESYEKTALEKAQDAGKTIKPEDTKRKKSTPSPAAKAR